MKRTIYQKAMWAFAHLIFPRAEVRTETPLGDEPSVYLGNHSGAVGPALMTLYFKKPHKTWMINYVLNKEKNANFIFHDFFFCRSKKHRKLWRAFSRVVAFFLRPLLYLSDPIPVYHDKNMMTTFKESLAALVSGENLVIFPECPTKYSEYVNDLYSGFCDLGRTYYAATGKKLKFYPVYAEKANRVISVGAPVEFDPKIPAHEQRGIIKDFIRDNIDRLARALPPHKPVPFLPEVWYEYYGEYAGNPLEYWKLFE